MFSRVCFPGFVKLFLHASRRYSMTEFLRLARKNFPNSEELIFKFVLLGSRGPICALCRWAILFCLIVLRRVTLAGSVLSQRFLALWCPER